MNNKKSIIFSVVIALVVISALFILPALPEPVSAEEGGDVFTGSIVGWMWSSNIGWIKLDSGDNPVRMDNGELSGYAWSPSIGWINFNPASTDLNPDYPSDPTHGVEVAITGDNPHAVSGWARACSVFVSGCSGNLKTQEKLGGWDGWIRMDNGATYDTVTHIFSGYAWGDLNLGWIQFNSPADTPPENCATEPSLPGCGVVCVDCGEPSCTDGVDCPENCTDGVDNDGDGLIDFNDPDCIAPCVPPEGEITLVNQECCLAPGVPMSIGEICPADDSDVCEFSFDSSVNNGSKRIKYYRDPQFNSGSSNKIGIIVNCLGGSSLNLISDGGLNSSFRLVCSVNSDPFTSVSCLNLGSSANVLVWVEPVGSLPLEAISNNRFDLQLESSGEVKNAQTVRFDYYISAGS